MKLYEVLFLIEGARAAQDFDGTEKELLAVLEKHGGKVRDKVRFEERKLAYAVRGHRRGAYLLAYFDAEPGAIREITADLNLSEYVLRTMIVRVEGGQVPEKKILGVLDTRPDRSFAAEGRDMEIPHGEGFHDLRMREHDEIGDIDIEASKDEE
ncbi:MAG: 30S ribosomal protein S6 [Planctomycetes bacterium]|jgi:ribosomal protein S6|nr:30S ribosomal protein S6 [Planctomycetota bacterium]